MSFRKMDNSSHIVSFVLAAYGDIGNLRYLFFIIIIFTYLSIICANILLITTICVERTLHEPMYLFLCSLFANELYGSTAVFPCLISQMLSDTHEVSFTHCFLQIFCLYTYANVEYCNLVAMAYDRYVSICHPLQYHVIMTSRRVCRIILLVWLYSFIPFTITYSLTVRLRFCGKVIDKVYCDLHVINRLACTISNVNNIYILIVGVVSITVPLIPISFSYFKILAVCLKSPRQTRLKAMRTCSPHIISLLNLSFGFFFEILQAGSPVTHVPAAFQVILSVYLMVFQPLLTPVLYGLNLSKIRNLCVNLLLHRNRHLFHRKNLGF